MIPLGIIPGGGSKTYDLISFLKPFIREINDLSNKGMRVKKNGHVIYTGKVFVLGITGDIPGIASLMNHQGHQSNYGCRMCKVKGEAPPGVNRGKYFTRKSDMRTKEELVSCDSLVSINNFSYIEFINLRVIKLVKRNIRCSSVNS
jgi:hypothetical protein